MTPIEVDVASSAVVPGSHALVVNSGDTLKILDPNASLVTVFGYHLNLSTILIGLMILLVVFAIYKVQSSSRLDFADMLTMDGKKVSLSKFLQFIGGLACTWFVLKTGLNGTLTEGIFGIYLTFIASIEGFSKFMSAKYNYSETSISTANKGGGFGDTNDPSSNVQQTLKDAANSAGDAVLSARDAQNAVKDVVQELK